MRARVKCLEGSEGGSGLIRERAVIGPRCETAAEIRDSRRRFISVTQKNITNHSNTYLRTV